MLVTGFWETALQNILAFFNKRDFHVSEFMASFPQNSKEKIKIEFLGHLLLYDDVLVHRFLMEEKYRN